MNHDPLYFAQTFGFFMELFFVLLGIWGFFWVLTQLVAPILHDIFRNIRRF